MIGETLTKTLPKLSGAGRPTGINLPVAEFGVQVALSTIYTGRARQYHIVNMYIRSVALIVGLTAASLSHALSAEPQCITFPSTEELELVSSPEHNQAIFSTSRPILQHATDFLIASKSHKHTTPILLDSRDDEAIHVAAQTFADDVFKVTGLRPDLYNDTLPKTSPHAIIVGSVGSKLVKSLLGETGYVEELKGKWESYDIRVTKKPLQHIEEGLVVVGSDRVSQNQANLTDISARYYFRTVYDVRADGRFTLSLLVRCTCSN